MTIKINGAEYLKIEDKLVLVDHFDEVGKPVIKTTSVETRHPNGRVDVTVHVPCLQIASNIKE